MGISRRNYVVYGIMVSDKEVRNLNLTDDQEDELNEHPNHYLVNAMDSRSFIFGVDIIRTDDGRWDDDSIPLTELNNQVLVEASTKFPKREDIPEYLVGLLDTKNVSLYVFTQFS